MCAFTFLVRVRRWPSAQGTRFGLVFGVCFFSLIDFLTVSYIRFSIYLVLDPKLTAGRGNLQSLTSAGLDSSFSYIRQRLFSVFMKMMFMKVLLHSSAGRALQFRCCKSNSTRCPSASPYLGDGTKKSTTELLNYRQNRTGVSNAEVGSGIQLTSIEDLWAGLRSWLSS